MKTVVLTDLQVDWFLFNFVVETHSQVPLATDLRRYANFGYTVVVLVDYFIVEALVLRHFKELFVVSLLIFIVVFWINHDYLYVPILLDNVFPLEVNQILISD